MSYNGASAATFLRFDLKKFLQMLNTWCLQCPACPAMSCISGPCPALSCIVLHFGQNVLHVSCIFVNSYILFFSLSIFVAQGPDSILFNNPVFQHCKNFRLRRPSLSYLCTQIFAYSFHVRSLRIAYC